MAINIIHAFIVQLDENYLLNFLKPTISAILLQLALKPIK